MKIEDTQIPNIDGQLAIELARELEFDAEALEHLTPGDVPSQFIQRLLAGERASEAVRLLAAALPRTAAVWWAARCVRAAHPDDLSSAEIRAMECAEAWLMDPDDERRRAAWTAANELGFERSAAWVCTAVFWHSGSMTPADQPDVEVPPHLLERAVSGAVRLAAAEGEAKEVNARIERYIRAGLELAKDFDSNAGR